MGLAVTRRLGQESSNSGWTVNYVTGRIEAVSQFVYKYTIADALLRSVVKAT
jgi:hypothetical protein